MISATEIIMIIIGFMAIVVGFVMPDRGTSSDGRFRLNEEEKEAVRGSVNEMVKHSVDHAANDIHDKVDDTLEEALLKSERSLERLTNEKISAIHEYSGTVLQDIHKNHDEVMFLYDMLNDKHKNLTELAGEVTQTAAEAKQTVKDAEITAENARAIIEEARIASGETAKKTQVMKDELEAAMKLAETTEKENKPFSPLLAEIKSVSPAPNEHVIESVHTDESVSESRDKESIAAAEAFGALSAKVISIKGKGSHPDKKVAKNAPSSAVAASGGAALTVSHEESDPLFEERQAAVMKLHEEGLSSVAIARKMGIGVGEVKLMTDLALRHRKDRRSL